MKLQTKYKVLSHVETDEAGGIAALSEYLSQRNMYAVYDDELGTPVAFIAGNHQMALKVAKALNDELNFLGE